MDKYYIMHKSQQFFRLQRQLQRQQFTWMSNIFSKVAHQ